MAEGEIYITGKTIINVKRLKIEGVNPDRLQYTVREYWDQEGSIYEVEHVPTGTVVRDWASGGLGRVVERCKRQVEGSADEQ